VSKEHQRGVADYWFGLKRTTKEALAAHDNAFCAFGLGSHEKVIVLPFGVLAPYLDSFFTSPDKGGGILHWHVRFAQEDQGICLMVNRDQDRVSVTEHQLKE
jgi:hypothetical protein